MNVEHERNTLIHIVYISMILGLLYLFFRYVMYMIMPFLLGFLIAFSLRPAVRHTISLLHLPQKITSLFYLLLFYGTIGCALTYLIFQCFQFLKDFLIQFPSIYELQIAPAFYSFILQIKQVLADTDIELVLFLQDSLLKFNASLETMAISLSSHMIETITNVASSLPNIFVSFFITIISSIFFALDFTSISTFVLRQFSSKKRYFVYELRKIIIETIHSYIFAYGKMMILTFFELSLGLHYLQVSHATSIALLISIFDVFPILGTGTIILPWVVISFFNHQKKFAVGLLILHLIINVVRQILEPKIVGKQIGLHPLVMLACMFFGVKLFGFLGIFLSPILLQVICRMNEKGLLHLYT